MSEEHSGAVSLEKLPDLRRKTENVSRFLQQQIAAHLETLRPLLAPDRIFGKQAGGKTDVVGTEKAMLELQQSYKPFSRPPYDLPGTLDTSWLTLVGSTLELHPWEYTHSVQGKAILMTSPVRWVVNYRTNYNFAQVKAVLSGKESVRPEYLRQFVVNMLVLQIALNRNPGLVQLFHDLRYEVKTESPPELKGLPVVTITSMLNSFRPADDLISAATAFSGVPAFIELLDTEAILKSTDPLQAKLDPLLK
ncbi:MAG TPA: hypothetical protein VG938_04110 [Verrucomicrobiae bacterium]|jgi:hypothetical protein|nr:hypothetical protein [Verrucomicrobiae bacterium]